MGSASSWVTTSWQWFMTGAVDVCRSGVCGYFLSAGGARVVKADFLCILGLQNELAEGSRRGDQAVGATGVVHKPSEAETALRLLASRMRALPRLPLDAGTQSACGYYHIADVPLFLLAARPVQHICYCGIGRKTGKDLITLCFDNAMAFCIAMFRYAHCSLVPGGQHIKCYLSDTVHLIDVLHQAQCYTLSVRVLKGRGAACWVQLWSGRGSWQRQRPIRSAWTTTRNCAGRPAPLLSTSALFCTPSTPDVDTARKWDCSHCERAPTMHIN